MNNERIFDRYNEALRRDEKPSDLLGVEDGSRMYQRHVSAAQADALGMPVGERIFLIARPDDADMTSEGWYLLLRIDHACIRAARAAINQP